MKETGQKMRTNRHAVDELADVREQLKVLKEREDVLKEHILQSGDCVGDEHVATVTEGSRSTLDRAKLEAKFGKAAIAALCKDTPFKTLRVLKLAKGQR